MEDNKRRTTDQGNSVTRELFVDASSDEIPSEKILDIEEGDEEDDDRDNDDEEPSGNE